MKLRCFSVKDDFLDLLETEEFAATVQNYKKQLSSSLDLLLKDVNDSANNCNSSIGKCLMLKKSTKRLQNKLEESLSTSENISENFHSEMFGAEKKYKELQQRFQDAKEENVMLNESFQKCLYAVRETQEQLKETYWQLRKIKDNYEFLGFALYPNSKSQFRLAFRHQKQKSFDVLFNLTNNIISISDISVEMKCKKEFIRRIQQSPDPHAALCSLNHIRNSLCQS